MTEGEMLEALQIGLELATGAHEKGQTLIAVGEMGIGNTTSASVITAVLTRQTPALVTGRGTGLEKLAYEHKISVVDAVIQKHFGKDLRISDAQPLEILRRVGGLEIAAMVGLFLGLARYQIPVITDGFISTAAAALAYAVAPHVKEYLFAGHCSKEPGHRFLLEYLGLEPILTLEMRLGEGTGAVLAMPIIESAVRLYIDMASASGAIVAHNLTVGRDIGITGADAITLATIVSGQAVLPDAHASDIYLTALGALLTLVYMTGLIFRPKREHAHLGIDSIAVIGIYALGIAGLAVIVR